MFARELNMAKRSRASMGEICLCVFVDRSVVDAYAVAIAKVEQVDILHACTNLFFEVCSDVWVVLEEDAGVFATLANAFSVVAEPCTALLDDFKFNGKIED